MPIEFFQYESLRKGLKEVIYDQDEPIDVLVDALTRAPFATKNLVSPLAIFFLLGQASSGKKFITSEIARLLNIGYKIFYMGEYSLENDAERLCTSAMNSGEISSFVKQYPTSVIVFDEIEKAHVNVQIHLTKFLRDADNGVNLSNIIVFFTSTLGKALYQATDFQDAIFRNSVTVEPYMFDLLAKEKKIFEDNIVETFAPYLLDLLSSLSTLIVFKQTEFPTLLKIAARNIQATLSSFEKKAGSKVVPEDLEKITALLVVSFSPYIDPHRLVHKISHKLIEVLIQNLNKKRKNYFSVNLKMGEKAELLYKEIMIDPDRFVRTIGRLRERVDLEWEFQEINGEAQFILVNALIKPIDFSTAMHIIEPVIEYASAGFDSVAGQHSVKKSLLDIVRLIKHPELLQKFGISRPKGVVLYGPQGTGKSLLAQAFAFEADLPFIRISGVDLFDPEIIRLTYTKARESAPSIVILDELDSKGIISGVVSPVPSSYIASYFDLGDVFTVATARSLEDLPTELIAPSALDMMIEVGELDKEARKFFIEKIFEKPHDTNIDIDKVAAYMTGMNGYDLQRIGTQAALAAVMKESDVITENILVEQINKIKYGEKIEPKRIRNPEEEIRMTAYHEAGHAVLSLMLLPQVKIEQVTVAPRSEALGFVSYRDEDFVTTATKDEIFKNLCVLLAGRVVKVKKFGVSGIDSGDVADIGQATLEAYAAIAHLGMDEELGYINILSLGETEHGGFMREKIERRVLFWLNDSKIQTETLVDKYWDTINFVAEKLIDREMLSGEELTKIVHEFHTAG